MRMFIDESSGVIMLVFKIALRYELASERGEWHSGGIVISSFIYYTITSRPLARHFPLLPHSSPSSLLYDIPIAGHVQLPPLPPRDHDSRSSSPKSLTQ